MHDCESTHSSQCRNIFFGAHCMTSLRMRIIICFILCGVHIFILYQILVYKSSSDSKLQSSEASCPLYIHVLRIFVNIFKAMACMHSFRTFHVHIFKSLTTENNNSKSTLKHKHSQHEHMFIVQSFYERTRIVLTNSY